MGVLKKRIKVIVADDEPAARASIEILLRTESDIEVIGQCRDGKEAAEAILIHQPDLVLLDIQMPEMDGFEVLQAIRDEHMPLFIFVTAYDQYALKAFEQSACDYLLKPYDDERFYQSLGKARELLQARRVQEQWKQMKKLLEVFKPASSFATSTSFAKRLTLKSQKRIHFLEVEHILYVESEGNFVKFYTKEGMKIGNYTFKQLQTLFDPEKFVRIHKSFMVNVDWIHYLEPHFHGDYFLFLKSGQKLKLSRNYKEFFGHLLG